MAAAKITWKLITVKAGDLKQNPDNPKIRDEEGIELLRKVTAKFGLIFSGIANKDLTLIDGHSRNILSKANDKVNVFVPSRQLTQKEFKEINALYDMARAGTTDVKSLEMQFTDEFFDEWNVKKAEKKTVSFQVKDKPPRTSWNLTILFSSEAERSKEADKLKDLGYKVELDK